MLPPLRKPVVALFGPTEPRRTGLTRSSNISCNSTCPVFPV